MTVGGAASTVQRGSVWEVLLVFLRLGLTSFGGPVAHLGYFREEYVVRRRWLDEGASPTWWRSASFCPGRPRARSASRSACCAPALGALAAWIGFTLPSAVALMVFASASTHSAMRRQRLVARPQGRRRRGRRPGGARAWPARWRRIAHARRWPVVAALILAVPRRLARSARLSSARWRASSCARPGAVEHGALPVRVGRPAGALALALFFVLLWACRCSPRRSHTTPWRCSTRSIARARWCSAAGTSCCRCCRRPSCRRAG